jgi:hypothetical protein
VASLTIAQSRADKAIEADPVSPARWFHFGQLSPLARLWTASQARMPDMHIYRSVVCLNLAQLAMFALWSHGVRGGVAQIASKLPMRGIWSLRNSSGAIRRGIESAEGSRAIHMTMCCRAILGLSIWDGWRCRSWRRNYSKTGTEISCLPKPSWKSAGKLQSPVIGEKRTGRSPRCWRQHGRQLL